MAPKKKAGKKSGKKLANMSEEERAAYLEAQRIAEEEKLKEKAAFLERYLRSKLENEERTTRFNMNKLNHQWRNIMREVKSKDLKKDIEILSQTFERVVDRKEAVTKALEKDLYEAEEQYAMALRSHIMNTDKLISLQEDRVSTLKSEYGIMLTLIREEFNSERALMISQHGTEMAQQSDILFALEKQFQEREHDLKSEFQSTRDEIKNKNLEEKHALRMALESAVEDLWGQFKVALDTYNANTAERKKMFETLKEKDEKSAEEIDMQMRKIHRINDKIATLKGNMAASAREAELRNKQLKEDKERMSIHFQEMKDQMNKLREKNHVDLMKLTVESQASIKALKAKVETGEKLLRMAEMSRKLETEEEKVVPFYQSSLSAAEQADVDAAVAEESNEKLATLALDYAEMENFWKRYNKVMLDKLTLDKEKQGLLIENTQLRTLLKQYLDGISVNNEILAERNSLMVVNNKSNVRMAISAGDSRVRPPCQVVVEAATEARQKNY